MKEWTDYVAQNAIVLINAAVLVIVIFGTLEAVVKGTLAILRQSNDETKLRNVYLHYGHWLVAALTFQLAADIIETSVAPTLEDVARLGAVAAIRVFLNYFLERDMSRLQEQQAGKAG